MPSSGRQAAEGAQPRARTGAIASQILVPKQAYSNEGNASTTFQASSIFSLIIIDIIVW